MKLVLLFVGVATVSSFATALLANLVAQRALDRVVAQANAKEEPKEKERW